MKIGHWHSGVSSENARAGLKPRMKLRLPGTVKRLNFLVNPSYETVTVQPSEAGLLQLTTINAERIDSAI
jgi:hypothetical protein